jgi:hypothetical protein
MPDISSTPYFTQDTPTHNMGSETPHFLTGSETPMVFGDATPSSRTPRGGNDGSDAIWTVNETDRQQRGHSTSTSMQNSPGHSLYSDTTSRRGGSGWGSSAASVSSYTNTGTGTDNSAYSGNRYSQQGSGMSSLVQSGSSTPMSMMGEMGSVRSGQAGSSLASSTGAGEVTFRDWTEDMVVLVKRGADVGRWAVIQQRPDEVSIYVHVLCESVFASYRRVYFTMRRKCSPTFADAFLRLSSQSGTVQLSLRDKNGGLLPGGFRLHYTDMDLAAPGKRERVIVLAGREKGKFGTVNVSLRALSTQVVPLACSISLCFFVGYLCWFSSPPAAFHSLVCSPFVYVDAYGVADRAAQRRGDRAGRAAQRPADDAPQSRGLAQHPPELTHACTSFT